MEVPAPVLPGHARARPQRCRRRSRGGACRAVDAAQQHHVADADRAVGVEVEPGVEGGVAGRRPVNPAHQHDVADVHLGIVVEIGRPGVGVLVAGGRRAAALRQRVGAQGVLDGVGEPVPIDVARGDGWTGPGDKHRQGGDDEGQGREHEPGPAQGVLW